jgi:hypothetical protein
VHDDNAAAAAAAAAHAWYPATKSVVSSQDSPAIVSQRGHYTASLARSLRRYYYHAAPHVVRSAMHTIVAVAAAAAPASAS